MNKKNNQEKHLKRELKKLDKQGRVISTSIVYDADAMLANHFPEAKKKLEEKNNKKKKGDVIPFK